MTIDDSGAATRGTETRAHARIAAHVPRGPHDASALFTVPTNSYGNREPRRVIPPLLSAPRLTHFACQPGSRNFWVIRPASPLITLLLLLPFFSAYFPHTSVDSGGEKASWIERRRSRENLPSFSRKEPRMYGNCGKKRRFGEKWEKGKGERRKAGRTHGANSRWSRHERRNVVNRGARFEGSLVKQRNE